MDVMKQEGQQRHVEHSDNTESAGMYSQNSTVLNTSRTDQTNYLIYTARQDTTRTISSTMHFSA